jgi:hypothetical protein
MKKLVFAMLVLALLCAGCVDKGVKDSTGKDNASNAGAKAVAAGTGAGENKLLASITSPKHGDILAGNKDFSFAADVKGGKEPYTYSWTSNIDGLISSERSFSLNPSKLSKGEHTLIFKVTDSSGSSAQSSILIRVM